MAREGKQGMSWAGWSALIAALLAVVVVARDYTADPGGAEARALALPLGATLARIETARGPRLIVSSLQTDGSGEGAGLKVGDEIHDVDGLPAPSIADFNADVASGSYDEVDLRVLRGRALIDIRLKRKPKEVA